MSKNIARIRDGLTSITRRQYEIIGGTVVEGSLDEGANTVSVQPDYDSPPIHDVMLLSVSDSNRGMTLTPEGGSKVVICTIDGPGLWTIIKMSELKSVSVKIGSSTLDINDTSIRLSANNSVLDIGDVMKMKTSGESLYSLLNDLIEGITTLTVGIPSGSSTVPVNVATFKALKVRLSNLLSS